MTIKSFALLILIPSVGWAGGSVVGNGAGVVENTFQFAYQNLQSTFSECITQAKCELTEAETLIVKSMRKVIELNRSNENRILFVSEKNQPGFFNTGKDENHRIAKTGLTAETPIYVNLDLLYTIEGKPAFDFLTITSILVHELGHQSGETNHAKLDIIGSKIKKNLLKKIQSHHASLDEDQIEVTIINRHFPFRTSDITVSWQAIGSVNVTKQVLENVTCKNQNDSLAGIEITNGHFTYLKKMSFYTASSFGFGFWALLSCYSSETETFHQEQKQIEISVDRDLNISPVKIQDL